jgi:hypothetical protein
VAVATRSHRHADRPHARARRVHDRARHHLRGSGPLRRDGVRRTKGWPITLRSGGVVLGYALTFDDGPDNRPRACSTRFPRGDSPRRGPGGTTRSSRPLRDLQPADPDGRGRCSGS